MNYTHRKIRELRLQLGMTQSELAEKVGYADKSAIARIEAGKIDITRSRLIAFAKALKTSPLVLLGIEDKEYTLNNLESELIDHFRSFNEEGQHQLLEQARMMASYGHHSKKNNTAEAMEG